MIKIISNLSGTIYQKISKPVLFAIAPEPVHDGHLIGAAIVGNIPPITWLLEKIWAYSDTILTQTIDGIQYRNPIGLAAGWDKDAMSIQLMPALGFGSVEVGSITKEPYLGNEGTRLWRLKKSKSIVVNYGLKNKGVDNIAERLLKNNTEIPLGTNIARTNSPNCANDQQSIEDYAYSFEKLAKIGDYFTINISCPNTFGGQPFHEKKRLQALLTKLDTISTKKPIYLKLSPDISTKTRKDIAELCMKHRVDGFICGNLTKNRQLATIKDASVPEQGGLSGKVVQGLSDQLISDMYRLTKGQKTIIGLGGVFSAEDAYKKIKLGASLVQLITGLIYEGPQIVGQINYELAGLIRADGYQNISQAIGVSHIK